MDFSFPQSTVSRTEGPALRRKAASAFAALEFHYDRHRILCSGNILISTVVRSNASGSYRSGQATDRLLRRPEIYLCSSLPGSVRIVVARVKPFMGISENTVAGFPKDSRRRTIRLILAFVACVVSFTFGLRKETVRLGDLYSRWYGVQQLLKHGRNPYGLQVSRDIQIAYYGHVLRPGEDRDEQRFAYPIYVVVLLWPMAFMRYATVDTLALPLLILAGAAFVTGCVRFMNWPRNKSDTLAAVFLGLSTSAMLRGLRFEQLSTLVALFVIAAFISLSHGRPIHAGVLLALATIKPQIALLPILWALVWALGKWSERKRLAVSLASASALLFLGGEILLPGWFSDFVRGLSAYNRYADGGSFLMLIAGKWVGLVVTMVLVPLLLRIMFAFRKTLATGAGFQFTTALVLALTALAMPAMSAAHNQILMFPAAFILLRDARAPGFAMKSFFVAVLAWTPVIALATALLGNSHFMDEARTAVGVVTPLIILILVFRYTWRLALFSAVLPATT